MLNASIREFEFTSPHDGLVISAAASVPVGNINGVVQIVHGMNEYKERYFDFMDYLASEGFACYIHDNRGHGRSICSEDDLGFMFRDGGQGFVTDIAALSAVIRKEMPGVPHFLIGHSMGSLGARVFLKEHDSEINGLILLGCPCYAPLSGFARSIDSAVSKKLGSRFRSDKIYEISENLFNKNFGGQPHSWICSDPQVVSSFNTDPLCSFHYTLNGYEGLLWLMRNTYSKKGWNVTNPNLPIRFISGKDDPVMLSEKRFFGAMKFLENAGYNSISHRLFDGMRHEVLNEKNNSIVYKDIAKTLFSWIDRLSGILAGQTAPLPPLPAPEIVADSANVSAEPSAKQLLEELFSDTAAPAKPPVKVTIEEETVSMMNVPITPQLSDPFPQEDSINIDLDIDIPIDED